MAPRTNYRVTVTVDVRNEKHIEDLIKRLERLQTTVKKDPMKPLRENSKKTQIEMRKFGRGLGNVSYQVQDMIVQISGGIDPLKSFSQQVPQMLIGLGSLGAVVGVVAAGMPLLIDLFKDGESAALDMSDSFGVTEESLSQLERSMQAYLDEGTQFQRQLVEINQAIATGNLVQYMKDLNEELSASSWDIWSSRAKAAIDSIPVDKLQLIAQVALAVSSPLQAAASIFAGRYGAAAEEAGNETARLAVELEKTAELFGINESAAATAGRIMDRFNESGKTLYDVRVAVLDLEDVLTTAFAAGDENAQGLRDTIEQLRTQMRSLAGNEIFQEITPQGSRVTPSTPGGGGGSEERLSRIVPIGGSQKMMDAIRAQEESLKRQEEIFRALNPEVAAYNAQMDLLGEALEYGIINQERFNQEAAKAKETLNGEQFDLMAEAAEIFNKSFDTMLDGILLGTRDIEDAFKDMAKVVIAQLLKLAAYKALAGIGGPIGTAAAGLLPNAQGNAFSGGNVVPFAKGGVVSSPTIFPMAKGAGLMGEAGPEAVMPLARTANGDLGVKSSGMSVTINNNAPGVEVRPRQTENGLTVDVVTRTLANSIRQGGNPLSDALEGSYSLSRGRGAY